MRKRPNPPPDARPRSASARVWTAVLFCLYPGVTHAEGNGRNASPSGSANSEIIRRQQLVQDAAKLVADGDAQLLEKNFEGAANNYREAVNKLPDAPLTKQLRDSAISKFCNATIQLAKEWGGQGKFAEAKSALNQVLADGIAPNHEGARKLLKELADPGRYNQAMNPQTHENIGKVERLLGLAHGKFELGNFDAALAAFNQVLAIDPYNVAARRGMEKTQNEISQYDKASRDYTRAKMLGEVDKQWDIAVPAVGPLLSTTQVQTTVEPDVDKLKSIIIHSLRFESTSLEDAAAYLSKVSRDQDRYESTPVGKGVNIVIRPGKTPPAPISLDVKDIPLAMALDYVAQASGTRWRREGPIVVFYSDADGGGPLEIRNFSVSPSILTSAPAGQPEDNPFDKESSDANGGKITLKRSDAKQFLLANGVEFPPGASANFDAGSGRMTVRNTPTNLDLVADLLAGLSGTTAKQIQVSVTMLTASDKRLKELGFDHLMGAFALGGTGLFGSGGTYGNAKPFTTSAKADFPAFMPSADPTALATPIGANPVTAGLRSSGNLGSSALEAALDPNRFINSTSTTRSPAALALTGAFTNPQFQSALRALDQQKGVDVSVANSIVMRSGQLATSFSGRDFYFPTEYEAPTVPQQFNQLAGAGPPVTPSMPTAFEKRELGQSLEVQATLSDDGKTVDLVLHPSFVEFLGFVNYGTPINIAIGGEPITVTPNTLLQPVFERVELGPNLAVSVYDGATLAIGGLSEMREANIEDKVPFLGDIPWMGRLFRSSVKETTRKAVVYFVTVKVIDPAGREVREQNVSER